jgi:Uma2 family endonuclease
MKFTDLDLSKSYTYADYLTWDFPERLELLLGKIFPMSPAPSTGHQDISSTLMGQIIQYFKNRGCKVFSAPFDVRLPSPSERKKPEYIDTVVQPDLCVVCDLSKLDKRGCLGPPDWIIEIMSPSTSKKDAQ